MFISMFNLIRAEGKPEEVAMFATLVLHGIKTAQRIDEEMDVTASANELFEILDKQFRNANETNNKNGNYNKSQKGDGNVQ